MLQYRLTNDTDDFVEGAKEQLVLFVIHNDVTFEHYIDHIYDTQRIIQNIKDFTIELMGEYINVKYYSMTFRLNPVGDNIKLIISLQERITTLEKKLSEIPKQITMQKKPPEYLPPNLSLLCEVEYLRWDTLEDLFYMYPLDETYENYKKFNKQSSPYPHIINYNYVFHVYDDKDNISLMTHKAFINDLLNLDIAIDTFDPNDTELNKIIADNENDEEYYELSKSCLPPYTQNKKINIHILNFISYISRYYITSLTSLPHTISIHCYVSPESLFIQIIKYKRDQFHCVEINGDRGKYSYRYLPHMPSQTSTSYYHKYRMNFYIDDWAAPPVVVYV